VLVSLEVAGEFQVTAFRAVPDGSNLCACREDRKFFLQLVVGNAAVWWWIGGFCRRRCRLVNLGSLYGQSVFPFRAILPLLQNQGPGDCQKQSERGH